MTPMEYDRAEALAARHTCGECPGGLGVAWGGFAGIKEWVLRCNKDTGHVRIRPKIYSRRGFEMPGNALATTGMGKAEMVERVKTASEIGMVATDFSGALSPAHRVMVASMALAYGLDPLMGELAILYGKPFVTLKARRRKDTENGHKPDISFRLLTLDEQEYFEKTEVLKSGDAAIYCILKTEWGTTVEGIGTVHKGERNPAVGKNPLEMLQKRAEARAREMAYGSLAGMPLAESVGVVESTSEIIFLPLPI